MWVVEADAKQCWDDFLAAWPRSRLATMTLGEYSQAGGQDTLCYWLESKSEKLGSIWGGSAFKFGIYSRKSEEDKPSGGGLSYGPGYAWYTKYGATKEAAFKTVRSLISRIADAASKSDLKAVEAIEFSPAIKWKLAFLYQDRSSPSIVPVYDHENLRAYAKGKGFRGLNDQASIYRKIREQNPDEDIIQLGAQVWNQAQEAIDDRGPSVTHTASAYAAQGVAEARSMSTPLNLILYGPPGTGKTHATVAKALNVLDPSFLATSRTRAQLTERFRVLKDAGRIRFVTFHQSFSYEDFVEGIRAVRGEDGQLTYRVEPGIFKMLCTAATAKLTKATDTKVDVADRTIWKMSLGDTQGDEGDIYDECISKGYVLLAFGNGIDYTGCKSIEDVQARAGKSGPISDHAAKAMHRFVTEMQSGDLIVVSDGNLEFRAIGEVRGPYRHLDRPGDHYVQCRDVAWHRVYEPSLPWDQLMHKRFMQKTLYRLNPWSIDVGRLAALLGTGSIRTGASFRAGESIGGYEIREVTSELLHLKKPNGSNLSFDWQLLNELADYVRNGRVALDDIRDKQVFEKVPDSLLERNIVNGYSNVIVKIIAHIVRRDPVAVADRPEQNADAWVLIIDEINRGNISKIFGELITLIEPSRRAGAIEQLSVKLPYSREEFSVPSNVYLIGTMNTADKSLAGLDIALRRRFVFEEMPPQPQEVKDITVEGVNLAELLTALNNRIEALRDADHCLGHSYFLPLRQEATLERLSEIFRRQIIPLLQEYFFDDWERIQWVLNDHAKPNPEHQFVLRPSHSLSKLFGDSVGPKLEERRWRLNSAAFDNIESYRGILSRQ